MIRDSWNNITLICGNHGEDLSHELQLKEYLNSKRDTVFYSCPEFKSIYGKKSGEGKSCINRLTVTDFERLLKRLQEASWGGDDIEETNLTGYRWSDKGIEYHVLKHEDDKFTVKVLNKKAISR